MFSIFLELDWTGLDELELLNLRFVDYLGSYLNMAMCNSDHQDLGINLMMGSLNRD
jgi:hypothetical protein